MDFLKRQQGGKVMKDSELRMIETMLKKQDELNSAIMKEFGLDIDSWTYGMNYKDDLLNLGFTKQEMDGFILDRYEELVKQKEEDEDD